MTRTLTIEIDEEADAAIRRQAASEGRRPEELAARWINNRFLGELKSMAERFPELAHEARLSPGAKDDRVPREIDDVTSNRRVLSMAELFPGLVTDASATGWTDDELNQIVVEELHAVRAERASRR